MLSLKATCGINRLLPPWVSGVSTDSFRHLEVFLVDATDGDGVAAEVEDELAVTVYADDVALVAAEGTGEDAELDVVTGELLEGGAEEGDLLGMSLHDVHEGLHDGVGDGGGTVVGAVLDEMVGGKVVGEKLAQVGDAALKKDKTAYGGLEMLLHASLMLLVLVGITNGLVDEVGLLGGVVFVGVVCLEPLLEGLGGHVLEEEIAPGSGHGGGVLGLLDAFLPRYTFYFRS